jgi:hypothetical protein
MAIVNHFYHRTMRRYIAMFGSLFNQIAISRYDERGRVTQRFPVPISYGPYQKFLARLDQDPNLDRGPAITLPRMSFEIMGMQYDGHRKINTLKKLRVDDTVSDVVYTPTPWNFEFQLHIMTKYSEDMVQIFEQISPFFKPDWNITAHIVDGVDPVDIPIVMNGVAAEDIYEGDFSQRRSLVWTIQFTMKGWLFGPERDRKIIKFVDSHLKHMPEDQNRMYQRIKVKPGLTPSGEPTSDEDQSIFWGLIDETDNWGIIVQTETELDNEQ